jgi:hypothetical protein
LPLEEEKKRKADRSAAANKLEQQLWGTQKEEEADLEREFRLGFDSAGYGGQSATQKRPSYLMRESTRLNQAIGQHAMKRMGDDNRAQVSLESSVPRYTISAPFWKEKPTDDSVEKKARKDAEKLFDDLYRDSIMIPSRYINNLGSKSLGKEYENQVNHDDVNCSSDFEMPD